MHVRVSQFIVFGCEIVSVYCLRIRRADWRHLLLYVRAHILSLHYASPLTMPRAPPRMSVDEKRLVRSMHFDKGMAKKDIAAATGRRISSVCRLLAQRRDPAPVGRPAVLTVQQVDRLERILNTMIDEADAQCEVTAAMLLKRSRCKASVRTVSNALHARGYFFRNLRQKPILTPDDVKERFAFARKFRNKPAQWWVKNVHLHWDNHCFKVATTFRGRKLLAMRRVRGAYRKRGKSLRPSLVKPNPKLRQFTGAKGVLIAGGVGAGRVLLWHHVENVWCGREARNLYQDVMAPALKKQFPRRRLCVLEDNDPTGNTSKTAIAAKRDCNITVFEIPKRSPELNVMDFAVWSEMEKRLRAQERKWPQSRRESREQFIKRVSRTAQRLPPSFISRSIMNLKERCRRLFEAKGGLFEEGGNRRGRRRPL